ncbi:MAG: DNA repair protein RecO [Sphingobacteriia bacterium]
MLVRTHAIVLRTIRYRDTSGITNLLTEHYGRLDCLVRGLYGARSSGRHSLFMPGTMLEVVVYHRPGHDLMHLNESSLLHPCHTILADPMRQIYVQLYCEILLKAVPNTEEEAPELYQLFRQALLRCNQPDARLFNTCICFLLALASALGILPSLAGGPYDPTAAYCLVHEQGLLQPTTQPDAEGSWLARLISSPDSERLQIAIPKAIRASLLHEWFAFMSYHLHADFTKLKSLRIFEEVYLS